MTANYIGLLIVKDSLVSESKLPAFDHVIYPCMIFISASDRSLNVAARLFSVQ